MATSGRRLGRWTRRGLVVLAAALTGVLVTASCLRPDPKGFGTHEQLGLSPCAFLAVTGMRCPSCGMTTAFAWAVRGRPDRAWRANPAGVVLAMTCAAMVPWLLACAASGRPRVFRTIDGPLTAAALAAVALALGAWTLRVLLWRALG